MGLFFNFILWPVILSLGPVNFNLWLGLGGRLILSLGPVTLYLGAHVNFNLWFGPVNFYLWGDGWTCYLILDLWAKAEAVSGESESGGGGNSVSEVCVGGGGGGWGGGGGGSFTRASIHPPNNTLINFSTFKFNIHLHSTLTRNFPSSSFLFRH